MSGLVFLTTFVSVTIGGALGMLVRIRLPEHAQVASKEVVRLGASLMGTVAALVLGLMIASAKNAIIAVTSTVYALLVSSALFLIVDMSQPFFGVMKISSEPLRHVLPSLGS